jgi:hypothetical protein
MDPWLRRVEVRAAEEKLLSEHPATLVIRPPAGSVTITRTERRPSPLQAAVETGRQAAETALLGGIEVPL